MNKTQKTCLLFLTVGILIGSVNIAPSLSTPLKTLTKGVESDGKPLLAENTCENDVSEVQLGSFLVTMPSGDLEGTTETVNGSTIINIGNSFDPDTKFAGLVVYIDDYRPIALTDEPDKVRELALAKNIEVWKQIGLVPGTPSVDNSDGTYSFKVDFREPGSIAGTVQVLGKVMTKTHEVVLVTIIAKDTFIGCAPNTFDIRLKD